MTTIRVLLLLRYGDELEEEKVKAAAPILAKLWPGYHVEVVGSKQAFMDNRQHFAGFNGWTDFAAAGVISSGASFHAFAVDSRLVGNATGPIITKGGEHNRPTVFVDLATGAWDNVDRVVPADASKRHDWLVRCVGDLR